MLLYCIGTESPSIFVVDGVEIAFKNRSGGSMCYNCGCQMPNNDMGRAENITNATFETAAEAMGMSIKESRQNALELLEKVLDSNEESSEKNWQP